MNRKTKIIGSMFLSCLALLMTGCQSNHKMQSAVTIDLGLPSGCLWAESNLGASSSEEAGYYFFWGDIAPCKKDARYKYVSDGFYTRGGVSQYLKYITDSEWGIVDGKIIMESQDDAANTMLGDSWSIPSVEDFNELLTYCTWQDYVRNGVEGILFVGPNGNSIFFPDLGHHADVFGMLIMSGTSFWTNSLSTDNSFDDRFAFAMAIQHTYKGTEVEIVSEYRTMGYSIRPVKHQ